MSREVRLYLDDMLEACRRVTNAYFGIDERIVWDVVALRAPSMARELGRFLAAPP